MIEYTVKRGDSLSAIGHRYGVPWKRIAELNDVPYWTRPDGTRFPVIHEGQVLLIPVEEFDVERRQPAGRPYDIQYGPYTDNWHADRRRRVSWYIIHDPGVSGVPTEQLLIALRHTDKQVSYSRVMSGGRTPTLYELVAPQHVAWHAGVATRIPNTDVINGAVNLYTLSLALVHPFPLHAYPALVAFLADELITYRLPDAGVILAHREISTVPGRRSDPRGIDMFRLRADVQQALEIRRAA